MNALALVILYRCFYVFACALVTPSLTGGYRMSAGVKWGKPVWARRWPLLNIKVVDIKDVSYVPFLGFPLRWLHLLRRNCSL